MFLSNIKIIVISIIFYGCLLKINAQDPFFSQFFANPVYLNPGFAGSGENTRFSTNFRNQNPSVPGAFITYSAAFDHYFQSLSSGIGIIAITDKAGEAQISNSSISGIYSYKVRINDHVSVNTGIQASYIQSSLNWNTFTFGDQIDNKQGFVNPTNEKQPVTSNVHSFDFSAGFITYTKNMAGGITLNHLSQPSTSHYIGNDKLFFKTTLFYIGKYMLNNTLNNKITFSPTVIYQRQHQFQYITGGAYLNKNPLIVGVLYRNAFKNSDALTVLAGIDAKSFRFIYSYDINLSKFVNFVGGSHEFSLYLLFENFKKNNHKTIICPNF